MRPPRLRCTLFSLIYPPHLLGSYKRQLYGFVLFSRLTKRNLASYVISVRRTKSSLTASFRFYLTIDTLAVQLYTSLSPRRVRDFHPLERAHGAQTKNNAASAVVCTFSLIVSTSLFIFLSIWYLFFYGNVICNNYFWNIIPNQSRIVNLLCLLFFRFSFDFPVFFFCFFCLSFLFFTFFAPFCHTVSLSVERF